MKSLQVECIFFLVLTVSTIAWTTFIEISNPVVHTNYGSVRGSKYTISHSLNNRALNLNIVQFIGVPYAAAPIGTNRFRPPRFPTEWTNELDCTGSNRVMCPQVKQRFRYQASDIVEKEDCLHLNIFVPVENRLNNLPVLVYIHGGEFKYGGKDFFKPDYLFSAVSSNSNQMIVVTINYRLGVLGFLSTDDENSPGNNGIRDQVLALQWIKENIAKFNGNSQKITLMGHDAGAASVGFHLLNAEASAYFTNAISVSGSIFSPWALLDNPLAMARDFASEFSCGYRPDQIVECLRYQDLNTLMATCAKYDYDTNKQPFWFRPVVDRNVSVSALLKDFPLDLYKSGSFNKKPYVVVGLTREGSLEYYLHASKITNLIQLESKIAFLIRPFLKYYTKEEILASAFAYKYFNRTQRALPVAQNLVPGKNSLLANQQLSLNNQFNSGAYSSYGSSSLSNLGYTQREMDQIFSELLSDFLYLGPIDYSARLHSTQASTAMIIFNFYKTHSFGPLQLDVQPQVSIDSYGVTHFNDIFYLLPNEYDPSSLTGTESSAAVQYTRIIVDIVLNGIEQANTNLILYTPSTPNYNLFNDKGYLQKVPANSPQNGFRTSYVDFINNYIYKLQDEAVFFPPYFPSQEYKSYQQATWTLVAVLVLIIIILVIVAVLLIIRKKQRNRKNELSDRVELKTRYEGVPLNS